MTEGGPCVNTDRELWRGPDEGCGDFYADSIHVTENGSIGISCGGFVYVKPLRAWHELARADERARADNSYELVEHVPDGARDA